MKIVRKPNSIRANANMRNRRPIKASEENLENTDLLFEAEDVADLVAEVTGEEVAVDVTPDAVEFTVGEDVYTLEPDEGDECELVEASKKVVRRKPVQASRNTMNRRRMPR